MKSRDINVLPLIKGQERYIFFYDDESRQELLRVFTRFAENPDLSFTWYDAAHLSQKIRQEREAEKQAQRRLMPQRPTWLTLHCRYPSRQ